MNDRPRRLRPPSGKSDILGIWEETVGTTLSPERRDEFLSRVEVGELVQLSVGLLETAADIVYVREGRLLLTSWLAAVPVARDAMPENRRSREGSYGQGGGLSTTNRGGVASIF